MNLGANGPYPDIDFASLKVMSIFINIATSVSIKAACHSIWSLEAILNNSLMAFSPKFWKNGTPKSTIVFFWGDDNGLKKLSYTQLIYSVIFPCFILIFLDTLNTDDCK